MGKMVFMGILVALCMVFSPADSLAQDKTPAPSRGNLPIDKMATRETVNLYRNLKKSLNKGILFGHQDDLEDFKKFYATDKILFQKEVTREKIYGK